MSTRFAVAVHILTFLQTQDGRPASSELLAASINTNASLVRRLLAKLAKAGLARSQMGTGGGALLARPASRITLRDIYEAVDEHAVVLPVHPEPNPQCPVGRNIAAVLNGRIAAAQRALQEELAKTSIADLAADITTREAALPAS